jgi:tripartite-type tricarboxylate transporter receptor subunit TctC
MKKIIALLACTLALGAHAQTWPVKPVRIVVSNSPGAATDLAGRVFADNFARAAGQPVAVENRPGADGYIGAQAVAQAAPDGYTLFFGSQSVFALDPHIKKVMPVDPVRDFSPIAVMIDDTGATGIFAHPSMPFSTLPELIAYSKANPGKLTVATTVPLFGMLNAWVNKRAGINVTEVRYKTTGQANGDALSGQVSMILTAFGPFEQYVTANRVKTIAVTRPVEGYSLPTFNAVWPDFEQPSFVVLAGPAKMPGELVQRINGLAVSIVDNPKFNQDLSKIRWRNVEGGRTPQATAEFIRTKREAWGRFIREIGLQPE